MCGRNEYLSNFEAGGTLVETLKKKKRKEIRMFMQVCLETRPQTLAHFPAHNETAYNIPQDQAS